MFPNFLNVPTANTESGKKLVLLIGKVAQLSNLGFSFFIRTKEMATLSGRIRNVPIVAADKDHSIESVHFLQNALKSLLERSRSSDRSKRQCKLDYKMIL